MEQPDKQDDQVREEEGSEEWNGEWNGDFDPFADSEERRVLFAALDSFRYELFEERTSLVIERVFSQISGPIHLLHFELW